MGAPTWRDDPDSTSPVVLVVGGFLTSPPLYVPFAARLRDRGAADVVIARVWLPDWLLAAWRGLGPLVTRTGRALVLAGQRSVGSPLSRGAPILLVGHSAGGLVGRLLTSPVPFEDRRLGAAERIGAIVTLGTPHNVSPSADIGGHAAEIATVFADLHVPGATFAPRVGYVSVASRAIPGGAADDPRATTASRFYRGLLGDAAARSEGDGLVPVESALLEGSTRIVLDAAVHGHFGGQPWYGSEGIVDSWWPAALESWHAALRSRVAGSRRRRHPKKPVDERSHDGLEPAAGADRRGR